jgi:hypothetical protein
MSVLGANPLLLGGADGDQVLPIQRSVRLRSSNSAYFNRTPATAGNRKTWTWSGWVKRGQLGAVQDLISGGVISGTFFYTRIFFDASDRLGVVSYPDTTGLDLLTTQVFRDPSAWYHIAVFVDSTQAIASSRARIYVNGVQVTTLTNTTYLAQNQDTMFNSTSYPMFTGKFVAGYTNYFDGYLAEVNFIDGQALTPTSFGFFSSTTGVWQPKRYIGTYGTNGFDVSFSDNSSVESLGYDVANSSPELITNGMFVSNVTGWTATNGTTLSWQSGSLARIANTASNAGIAYFPISTVIGQTYYARVNVAAVALGAAGRNVGIYKSDNIGLSLNQIFIGGTTAGTYQGTFTATATTTYIALFGDVYGSGNADFNYVSVATNNYKNNWKPFGISLTAGATYDSMIDTPTPYSDGGNNRGNYPTLLVTASQGNGAYTEGNLGFKSGVTGQWRGAHASMFMPSGKFYFEATIQALSGNNFFMIGACGIQTTSTLYANLTGQVANGWGVQCNGTSGGTKYNNNGTVNVSNASFAGWVVNDVLQCAVDVTNGRIWFGKNNVWLEGSPSAGTGASYTNLTGAIAPSVSVYGSGVDKLAVNCGQRPFAYTPPTGFLALNSFNLPTPTIPNGALYMAATTYTGNGTSQSITNTVNGVSFQPDWVWVKNRANGAADHILVDSVRGATNWMSSDLTAAEATNSAIVSSINSNGFSVGSGNVTNQNATAIVGWQWKAGGTAVTNTAGTITSTVSANPSAGFSIVTWTGTGANATVGHGLGIAPSLVIVKNRDFASGNWISWHKSLLATQVIWLNVTNAAQANSGFNNTAPTSTVFSVGTVSESNGSTNRLVAYCFSEIEGYSKFGTYTGNGVADGMCIYLGFRPRWIMLKNASAAGNGWIIIDTSRSTFNQTTFTLFPNSAGAETNNTTYAIDIVSNGFKVRATDPAINGSTNNIVYAAFAENPFKNSLAR